MEARSSTTTREDHDRVHLDTLVNAAWLFFEKSQATSVAIIRSWRGKKAEDFDCQAK